MFSPKEADVIILTYNRKELLLDILERLKRQERASINVIVTDDGTKEPIDPSKHSIISKYIWALDEGYGRVSALNCAIDLAVSENIIILDDDCLPIHNNWAFTHIESLKNHQISSGKIFFPSDNAYASGWFSSTNMGIKTDIIRKVGKFDKNLNMGYGQDDIVLMWELKKHGYTNRIADVEHTLVHHVGKMYADGDRSWNIVGKNVQYCIDKYGIDPRNGVPW
jgi:GT2 family glycosyltransferase